MKQATFVRGQDLRMALALGAGVALIYLAFLPPGSYSLDGNAMLAVSESLITKGDFAVPPELGKPGVDGRYYSSWYPLLSIVAIPFVATGAALGETLGMPSRYVAAVCALVLSALLTAATTSLIALLALRLGSTGRGACLAALSFAFGTIAMVYGRTFFAEPLLAFLTIGGLYLTVGGAKREILAAGVFTGLAVLAKPAGVLMGPILSAYLLAKRRALFIALTPMLGTTIGVLAYGVYNHARFGDALATGQPWSFGAASVPEGFVGLLISPGVGLLWYCPPVVLAVVGFRLAMRSKALETVTIVASLLGYLLLHSFWAHWYGGWSWGPRLLMPAIPGLLALSGLVEGRWRMALLVLTVVGFTVNAPTLLAFHERYYVEAHEQGISLQQLLWSPGYSPLLQGWGAAYRQVNDALGSDVKELVRQAGTPETRGEMLRVVAVWWWVLPAAGVAREVGAAAALLIGGAGTWIILRVLASAREEDVPPHGAVTLQTWRGM